MTDEDKLAEEWLDKRYLKDMGVRKPCKEAYLAGFKAGRPQWHKVADGGDLPKNNTAVLVILKNKRMKISTFMENKFTIWNNDYDAYTKLYDVIAWCEVPKFEE